MSTPTLFHTLRLELPVVAEWLSRKISALLQREIHCEATVDDYFISPFNCGDKSETHTVREWLTDFNLPVEDRYFLSWHAFISEVCLFIRKIEGKVSDKLLDTIWTTIYQLIYLCYDTGEDFMTQFERNKSALLEIIQESKKELGDVT